MVKFRKDIAEIYSSNRKGVTVEDADDLLRIMFKYIRERMESEETYAIKLPNIGTLYKDFSIEDYEKVGIATTKEEKLLEKQFINSIFKTSPRKIYDHKDYEFYKNHTNNNS
jgi:hypothetical protein